MAAKKGSLSISSENIFPIIKKWVYSDHDIFARELVSNGCDAITKLKKLDMMGEYQLPDDYKPAIKVEVNPEEKTLKFTDNGLGMTADEVEEYIASGEHTFEKDFLPVIQAVLQNPKRDILQKSFLAVTDHINERIIQTFHRGIDADLVLYLGLCNAAGWVTSIHGRDVILLGIEKILELGCYSRQAMYGLIYHELGHLYHKQYGKLEQESEQSEKNFVWQLFTEGIAMYFEQVLVGDDSYYHQDENGWKSWCDRNFVQILDDFHHDLPTMSRYNQRYFGDWCDYHGHGDVGYYLGTRFVRTLLDSVSFDALIGFDIDFVYEQYLKFYQSIVTKENHH